MPNDDTPPRRKVVLPDYETNLRENAYRVLREDGVPEDQLEAEWQKMRNQPFPVEIPSWEELERLASDAPGVPDAP